ncbi:hypothetical protein BAUCODRAFT_127471 [Baudoinia panamericana UAMH 10762]|uniref:Uncharacterized protein n=1 Tax=Baudoinia panamericana (strain UAMH 10762) TaxID=717646 RepID=M2MI77_BAUPA|nr:uncharacterized protein BAUCODRAFT_127471 [Baudoinia panamericana UAMH 10762]EMC90973.1 hypothetical protein BAUCODRAFT_127471 [Baudoinia panamericana UAMH 10762]
MLPGASRPCASKEAPLSKEVVVHNNQEFSESPLADRSKHTSRKKTAATSPAALPSTSFNDEKPFGNCMGVGHLVEIPVRAEARRKSVMESFVAAPAFLWPYRIFGIVHPLCHTGSLRD